jgi:hypothetical protein
MNYPTWWHDNKENWTEEQWILARKECDEFDKPIKEEHIKKCFQLNEARNIVYKLFGHNSKEGRYLSKLSLRHPVMLQLTFEAQYAVWKKNIELKAQKSREDAVTQKQNEYEQKCVEYLLREGKVLGIDFNLNEAVEVAEEMHFDKLVKGYKDNDDFIDFSGDDNCESCEGWNPNDGHRCDCGNRRVSFCNYDFSIFSTYLSAEAY